MLTHPVAQHHDASNSAEWRCLREIQEQLSVQLAAELDVLTVGAPTTLDEVLRYAVAGGKRLRGALLIAAWQVGAGSRRLAGDEAVWKAAVAVECVHAMSLVHDDLPAIDDSDLRRGRPAVHRRYDEATAILAGDALLVLAYELLAGLPIDGAVRVEVIQSLSRSIGPRGVLGGQMHELASEPGKVDRDAVTAIHARKTAALLRGCCGMGALLARAPSGVRQAVEMVGYRLGLAFQAVDDLLDREADERVLGKPVGQDRKNGRPTLPDTIGVVETRRLAERHLQVARRLLDTLRPEASLLRTLVDQVSVRQR